ncbi:MAG: hypothetical protein ACKVXR_04050 [Planctomycetota bacterium]
MSLDSLTRHRAFALGAGVAFGAGLLLLILSGASAATQGPPDPPPTTAITPQPMIPAFGTADSNGSMIAVTGIDLTGASILYLVDTQTKHLAIYQATGGAESSQGVKLVGARRIDLDLQLDGLNDKSQYSVQELERKFAEIGGPPADPAVKR